MAVSVGCVGTGRQPGFGGRGLRINHAWLCMCSGTGQSKCAYHEYCQDNVCHTYTLNHHTVCPMTHVHILSCLSVITRRQLLKGRRLCSHMRKCLDYTMLSFVMLELSHLLLQLLPVFISYYYCNQADASSGRSAAVIPHPLPRFFLAAIPGRTPNPRGSTHPLTHRQHTYDCRWKCLDGITVTGIKTWYDKHGGEYCEWEHVGIYLWRHLSMECIATAPC